MRPGMKHFARWTAVSLLAVFLGGCVLTKVVTVPMRLGGAAVSIVPVVGNSGHEVVDRAADKVDDLPI